ncbi:ketopantoate reductase family protein [Chloroflexota bacterium]
MRIIIYGAGAIGCVVGGHLARIGHEVTLIGRPGQVKAIQENGLRFVTPIGTFILNLPAFTSPTEIKFRPDDVVFLSMKGQNTADALCDLHAVAEDVPIFCLQNGVRNEETAARYFKKVYGVMVRLGALYLKDGEVFARRDPPGWLVMGCYPKGTDELVETVAANLRAASLLVKVTPDVMPYKWGKLTVNLANAVTAITDVVGNDIESIVQSARQEAREIMTQAGIHWVSPEQVAQEWPEIAVPPRSTLPDVESGSSAWQSLSRGQGTIETDFFNGEIVRQAKQLGHKAPINETLVRISQEMAANREPPGKYTPAQLSALLGLEQS